MSSRVLKLALVLGDPTYRAALRCGVAASVELEPIPFAAGVRTVIDAGANHGQFAAFALRRFPGAIVHSFEPLAAPRARLERFAARAGRVRVHPVALGATARTATMHVLSEDDSSSLLTPTARQLGRGMAEAATASVPLRRLDGEIAVAEIRPRCLLKIDVQGSELEVLRGAEGLLAVVDEILVECSYVPFYEGQPLAAEVTAHLAARSFTQRHALPSIVDRGRVLQADLLFARRA